MEINSEPLAPSFLLGAPIALWLQFGDATTWRTTAILLGAALICWAYVRTVAARTVFASDRKVTPATRMPARNVLGSARRHRGLARPPRRSRDLGCQRRVGPIERRPLVRRTRRG